MLDNVSNVATAASANGSPFLEVAKTWIAYIGVLATAMIVAFGGIRKALKDIRGNESSRGSPAGPVDSPAVHRTIGGAILDTTTILMWSESNKGASDAMDALVEKLDSVIHCINYNTEAARDMSKDITELRHQIERLRDKLP